MSRAAESLIVACSVAAFCAAMLAQTPGDRFTATASVKGAAARATADVAVTVTRYATDAERDAVLKAVREGGTAAAQKVLAGMKEAGFIQLGERRTPIKFAGKRSMAGGSLVTVLTSEPIVFLGAGLPDAKPKAGYDVAIAFLEVKDAGGGVGELAPAAKIKVDPGGALVTDDYGGAVLWLNGIAPAKR